MTFCQGDRSMAPICEVDETKIKVASSIKEDVEKIKWQTYTGEPTPMQEKTKEKVLKRLDKNHMRMTIPHATKILYARTFTFQFKLSGFSFTSLTHYRSPPANFADWTQ
ncbi:hypothetical protein Bca101_058084 [Brassica carinata]